MTSSTWMSYSVPSESVVYIRPPSAATSTTHVRAILKAFDLIGVTAGAAPSGYYAPRSLSRRYTVATGSPTTFDQDPSIQSTKRAARPWMPYAPAFPIGSPLLTYHWISSRVRGKRPYPGRDDLAELAPSTHQDHSREDVMDASRQEPQHPDGVQVVVWLGENLAVHRHGRIRREDDLAGIPAAAGHDAGLVAGDSEHVALGIFPRQWGFVHIRHIHREPETRRGQQFRAAGRPGREDERRGNGRIHAIRHRTTSRNPGDPNRGRAFATSPVIKEKHMVYGLASGMTETLRDAVLDEIDRDPSLRAWQIGIAAEDGMVTLTGVVETQAERIAAERAVRRVDGVRSVANDLRIRGRDERTDTDIAREVANRLRNNIAVPESVQAVVSDGYVTLEGTVSWMHQRAAAETAVKYLRGVKAVENAIRIVEF